MPPRALVWGLGLPLELPIGSYKQGFPKDQYISRLARTETRNPHKTLLILNTTDSTYILCHKQRYELDMFVVRISRRKMQKASRKPLHVWMEPKRCRIFLKMCVGC